MSKIRKTAASSRTESIVSTFDCADISVEQVDNIDKPRLGLGSTSNENIALRRNYREMEQLWRKQKMLGNEKVWVLKLIELYEKSVQVNYKRLTKRVSRIHSYLTEEEIIELENNVQKKQFAEKYRKLLRNEKSPEVNNEAPLDQNKETEKETQKGFSLETIKEEGTISNQAPTQKSDNKNIIRSQTTQNRRRSSHISNSSGRPSTSPYPNGSNNKQEHSDLAMNEIIPSLEELLDQLHNIKPQQFYENQRKLKLYDIKLQEEEFDLKKEDFFKTVDKIINWDKKPEEESEEERKKREEAEKPKRKTSFMRSVLRNFSMELMMKTRQYGWTDLGQCRYLRNKDGGEPDVSGANTLARDTMKINLAHDDEPLDGAPLPPRRDPGFDENGKLIRTADLLGLKSYDD